MRIKTKETIFTIDKTEELLKPFVDEGDDFSIKLKVLSLKDQSELDAAIETGDKKDKDVYKIISAMAKKIIVGWEGFKDDEGKTVRFSQSVLEDLVNYSPEFILAIIDIYREKVNEREHAKKK